MKEKGTERTWLEINLKTLLENNRKIKALLPDGVKTMAIVKADAYGHGAVVSAKYLENDVDAFGVASASEAIDLRKAGIKKDILILGGTFKEDYSKLKKYKIMPTIFSYESAREFADARGKNGRCFLAVDTGMGRIGLPCDVNGIDVAEAISKLRGLEISGVFSHIARADEYDKTSAKNQLDNFKFFLDGLKKRGVDYGTASISNSASIMELDPKYDMVREGIILYGIYPSAEVKKEIVDIKPVLSFRSRIEFIKTVPAGTGISYGHTYTTDKETKIATVLCGYADGYPRLLSNKGRVLINGKFAPIIGRICMDQFMVDISYIPDAEVNGVVTLIGKDGENEITVEEIAELSSTIPYEILTGLVRPRIPRIYDYK